MARAPCRQGPAGQNASPKGEHVSVRIRHPPIRIRRRISAIFGYPYIRIRRITDIRDGLTDSIRIKRIIRIMADNPIFTI